MQPLRSRGRCAAARAGVVKTSIVPALPTHCRPATKSPLFGCPPAASVACQQLRQSAFAKERALALSKAHSTGNKARDETQVTAARAIRPQTLANPRLRASSRQRMGDMCARLPRKLAIVSVQSRQDGIPLRRCWQLEVFERKPDGLREPCSLQGRGRLLGRKPHNARRQIRRPRCRDPCIHRRRTPHSPFSPQRA